MADGWELLTEHIFNSRFSSIGVSEMRKVLFAAYMQQFEPGSEPSDYEVGRALGYSAKQIKNLRVGARQLLLSDGQARNVVQQCLERSFTKRLVTYKAAENSVSVQITEPDALDYLTNSLERNGIFRDVDVTSSHIAVPLQQFSALVGTAFEDLDQEELDERILEVVPEEAKPDLPQLKGEGRAAFLKRRLSKIMGDAAGLSGDKLADIAVGLIVNQVSNIVQG